MNVADEARAKRLHAAFNNKRAQLISELAEAQKRHSRLQERAKRFDPLAGPDAQRQLVERIETLQQQLEEHDKSAVSKMKTRFTNE